jgi:hypothetical protein
VNSLKREWETVRTGLELNAWRILDECSDIIADGLTDISEYKTDWQVDAPDEKKIAEMKIDELRDYANGLTTHVNVTLQDARTELKELCEDVMTELNSLLADLPATINDELSRFSLLKFYNIL